MTCSRAHISAYYDGNLPAAERRMVEGHLRRCPKCRASLQDYQAIRRGISALPHWGAPPSIAGEVRAQLAARRLQPLRQFRWSPMVAAAAAVTVLLGASLAARSFAPSSTLQSPSRPVVAFAMARDQATGVPPEAVIEIRFNAPVDRDAVQQSLNVSPPVATRLEWQPDKVLIVPEQRLDPDTTYTISVGAMTQKPDPVHFSLRTSQTGQIGDAAGDGGSLVHAVTRTPTASMALAITPSATPSSAQPAAVFRVATAVTGGAAGSVLACTVAPGQRYRQIVSKRRESIERLGCPHDTEDASLVTAQPFEGGAMLWSRELAGIYVLSAKSNAWDVYQDDGNGTRPRLAGAPALVRGGATPTPAMVRPASAGVAGTPPRDQVQPSSIEGWRHMTRLWLLDPGVRELLGLPAEKDLTAEGSAQEFDHGLLVGVRGDSYVIWDDHTWLPLSDDAETAKSTDAPRVAP